MYNYIIGLGFVQRHMYIVYTDLEYLLIIYLLHEFHSKNSYIA